MADKIMKTTRILFRLGPIYVSTKILDEVRDLVVRMPNNRFAPKRDCSIEVFSRLQKLAQTFPEHFTDSGRARLITQEWEY
jgi:hypothetical protein